MSSPTRTAARPLLPRLALGAVAVGAAVAVAFAVASTWTGRAGIAVALAGGILGVALMAKALRAQSETHVAELREQARRAHEQLAAQHARERETLAALDLRTATLQDTILSLRSHLEEADEANADALARLDESEDRVAGLEGEVAELSQALAATQAELDERTTALGETLGERTAALAVALDRVTELEAMVALYEEELTATPGAEVFGLPRRVERPAS